MRSLAVFALPTAFAALAAATGNLTTGSNGTYVNLLIPDANSQALVASVVATSADLTTFVVACPTGTPSENCGFPKPFTLTEGPTTVAYKYEEPGNNYTMNMNCAISGTASAMCTAAQVGGNSPGTQTYPVQPSFLPVSVTAGQAVLATGTSGGALVTGPSATAPASSGPASKTSTAAAAKMTGNLFGGLTGVAAAAAMAIMI